MSIETLKRNKGVDIELWLPAAEVEQEAQLQLHNIASLPWCFSHVAVMPDCHMGKGATVGSVIAMKDACSPSAVGVDIGCGMNALMTTLKASDLPDSLSDIRLALEGGIAFIIDDKTFGDQNPKETYDYGRWDPSDCYDEDGFINDLLDCYDEV